MAKKLKGPQILISNRLADGRVQFLTAGGSWSHDATDAWLTENEEEREAALAIAGDFVARNQIIEPEFLEAELTANGPRPKHPKYLIQNTGPTVRPDLGYQSEGKAA